MKVSFYFSFFIIIFLLLSNINSKDFYSEEYSAILKKYTKNIQYKNLSYIGVDYKNLDVKNLISKAFIDTQKFPVNELKNNKEKLSFYINVYNISMIYLVLQHYPISSIMDLGKDIFDKKFIFVNNHNYSLNEIEHSIIRKQFKEPRIHFALVCAAISCPDLRQEMYYSKILDKQLHDQTVNFLNSTKGIYIQNNILYISSLFDWYKEDFGTTNENIINFIKNYTKKDLNKIKNIQFIPYYWDLNDYR